MANKNKPHNIVVCCDGTWCGAETGTRGNIQIIADGFASQGQNAHVQTLDGKPVYNSYTNTDICYFDGAGLDGSLGLLGGFGDTLLYIANGIIANDLPERCKEAYGFIMDNYKGPDKTDPVGSRVWLFGLSRGAYTVRAVAGMINNCGIHNEAADKTARDDALKKVWKMYRSDKQEDHPEGAEAKRFRADHSWLPGSLPPVIFMGLLDTVGAVGIPRITPQDSGFTYAYKFRDFVVSSEVQHVFQAASTHDRLAPFEPCPVHRSNKLSAVAHGSYTGHYLGSADQLVDFSLQEVWYPGAHYDLGRQDFVFSNQPIINTLFRVFNPLRTNVSCTPELADYPLLGRALPGHGGPSPPQRLIGVPSTAQGGVAPAESTTGTGSSSSSSSSPGIVTGTDSLSKLSLVAQVNTISDGMLPQADDAAWEHLCGSHSLLLWLLQAGMRLMLPAIWVLQKVTAWLQLPLFQPAYTIDAESKILGPVVDKVAYLLGTEPELLLKDRVIPLPKTTNKYGLPIGDAVFFPVPRDKGTFDSYKPDGREGGWFTSKTYVTYQQGLSPAATSPTTATAAAATTEAAAGEPASAEAATAGLNPALHRTELNAAEKLSTTASSSEDIKPGRDQNMSKTTET